MSKSNKFWYFVLNNLRYFLLVFLIMFYLVMIIYITYVIGYKLDNIRQYYILKTTGCNIFSLNYFIENASKQEINSFYSYFNNLILYPTIDISNYQMKCIKILASLKFIPMYYMPILYILISIVLLTFILNIILFINYYVKRYKYIKYKWFYSDIDVNYNYYVTKENKIQINKL